LPLANPLSRQKSKPSIFFLIDIPFQFPREGSKQQQEKGLNPEASFFRPWPVDTLPSPAFSFLFLARWLWIVMAWVLFASFWENQNVKQTVKFEICLWLR
jgi:hypothetical protein